MSRAPLLPSLILMNTPHSQCDGLLLILPIVIFFGGTFVVALKIYQWAENIKREAKDVKTMRDQGMLLTVYVYYLQVGWWVGGSLGRWVGGSVGRWVGG